MSNSGCAASGAVARTLSSTPAGYSTRTIEAVALEYLRDEANDGHDVSLTNAQARLIWAYAERLNGRCAALAALLRQREAKVEKQAIDFELERSEMARQALDARMRLLTAQASRTSCSIRSRASTSSS